MRAPLGRSAMMLVTKKPRLVLSAMLASSLIVLVGVVGFIVLAGFVVLLGGCKVGPNYRRPAVQPPTAFRELSNNPQVQAQAASYADLPWWQVFQDPQLQELIRTALKQNYDLQLATERINAARAQVAITRSSLFPQVHGDGDFVGGKSQFFPLKANLLELAPDVSFQLDL